ASARGINGTPPFTPTPKPKSRCCAGSSPSRTKRARATKLSFIGLRVRTLAAGQGIYKEQCSWSDGRSVSVRIITVWPLGPAHRDSIGHSVVQNDSLVAVLGQRRTHAGSVGLIFL